MGGGLSFGLQRLGIGVVGEGENEERVGRGVSKVENLGEEVGPELVIVNDTVVSHDVDIDGEETNKLQKDRDCQIVVHHGVVADQLGRRGLDDTACAFRELAETVVEDLEEAADGEALGRVEELRNDGGEEGVFMVLEQELESRVETERNDTVDGVDAELGGRHEFLSTELLTRNVCIGGEEEEESRVLAGPTDIEDNVGVEHEVFVRIRIISTPSGSDSTRVGVIGVTFLVLDNSHHDVVGDEQDDRKEHNHDGTRLELETGDVSPVKTLEVVVRPYTPKHPGNREETSRRGRREEAPRRRNMQK